MVQRLGKSEDGFLSSVGNPKFPVRSLSFQDPVLMGTV